MTNLWVLLGTIVTTFFGSLFSFLSQYGWIGMLIIGVCCFLIYFIAIKMMEHMNLIIGVLVAVLLIVFLVGAVFTLGQQFHWYEAYQGAWAVFLNPLGIAYNATANQTNSTS